MTAPIKSSCPTTRPTTIANPNPNSKHKDSFPVALMKLLDDPTNDDVLTYLPDGESFVIVDPKKFTTDLMPQHFQVARFSTFTRRLKRWGFAQDAPANHPGETTPDREAANNAPYRHAKFRRGDMEACRKMRCKYQSRVKFAGGVKFNTATGPASVCATVTNHLDLKNKTSLLTHPQHQHLKLPLILGPKISLHLSSQAPVQAKVAPPPGSRRRPLEREIKMQVEYAQRLRLQAALQKRAIEAGGSMEGIIPQRTVDCATKAVVGAAIASIKRDRLFEKQKKRTQIEQLKQIEKLKLQQALEARMGAPPVSLVVATALSQQQQQQQLHGRPAAAPDLDAMASRLLSSSNCFGTHDNLAAMARVVKLKTQVTVLRQDEHRRSTAGGSSSVGNVAA